MTSSAVSATSSASSQPPAVLPRRLWPRTAFISGVIGTVLVTLGSFGAGGIRHEGGVLAALGLEFLSYGHGAGISRMLLWAGTFLLVGAWCLLGRSVVFNPDYPHKLTTVRRHMIAWAVPLLLSAPILTRDIYIYLMQGQLFRDGFDPYTHGVADNPTGILPEVFNDWRTITTPYGPLHIWMGATITRFTGDNVTAGVLIFRAVFVAGFAVIALAVPKIARLLGASPSFALWLGVANPLMLLHLVAGLHNEAIMVALIAVGVLLALHGRFLLSVAAIAVAISLKATAIIALPFIVWLAVHHFSRSSVPDGQQASTRRKFSIFVISGFVAVAETGAIMAAITAVTGANWGWMTSLSGNSRVVNLMSLPSLAATPVSVAGHIFDEDFPFNTVLEAFRTIGAGLLVVGLIVVWWLFRKNAQRAVQGICIAYVLLFVLSPVAFPWYYAAPLAFVGVTVLPRTVAMWVTGLMLVLSVTFTGDGNHMMYSPLWMGAAALGAWILTEFIYRGDHTHYRRLASTSAETEKAP